MHGDSERQHTETKQVEQMPWPDRAAILAFLDTLGTTPVSPGRITATSSGAVTLDGGLASESLRDDFGLATKRSEPEGRRGRA